MPLAFAAVLPEELAELVRFLTKAFGIPEDAPFLEERLLDWKYFAQRPDWKGPRSYALKQAGHIVAHGCVYPVSLQAGGKAIRAIRVIDWAGSSAVPGSGILLMRKLAGLADVVLAPGGSDETRAVLPKTGFKPIGKLEKFAAVVRPWLHLRTHPRRDWKTPARLARNVLHALPGLPPVPPGWEAERVQCFDDSIANLIDERIYTRARRDPALLDFMLACPGAEFAGYLVRHEHELCGWFITARALGQARIADLRAPAGEFETAWTLALRTAASDPRIAEVITAASVDSDAILAAGFHRRGAVPILVFDPNDVLRGAPPVALTLLDGDECFLTDPANPYT